MSHHCRPPNDLPDEQAKGVSAHGPDAGPRRRLGRRHAPGRTAWLGGTGAWVLLLLVGLPAVAQAPAAAPAPPAAPARPMSAAADPAWAELAQADAALGARLMAEHRCSECHVRRVGGDGSAIYKPQGRIGRPSALIAMVEMCNTELKLQLFPEDVAAIAKALNEAHYRFTPRTP